MLIVLPICIIGCCELAESAWLAPVLLAPLLELAFALALVLLFVGAMAVDAAEGKKNEEPCWDAEVFPHSKVGVEGWGVLM